VWVGLSGGGAQRVGVATGGEADVQLFLGHHAVAGDWHVHGVEPVQLFTLLVDVGPDVAVGCGLVEEVDDTIGQLEIFSCLSEHQLQEPLPATLILTPEPEGIRHLVASHAELAQECAHVDHLPIGSDVRAGVIHAVSLDTELDSEILCLLAVLRSHRLCIVLLLREQSLDPAADSGDLHEDDEGHEPQTFELINQDRAAHRKPPVSGGTHPDSRAFHHITAPYFCQWHF